MVKKGRILFDLGHDEDPLELLIERLSEDGFICDTYKNLISSEVLEPYTALFLSYPRKVFETEEKEAIVEFSKGGGSVTITANPQSQKEYEIFKENKGELIKSLLNTEINYKQLFPVVPVENPELISTLLEWPRKRKEIPPHIPHIQKEGIKLPLPYVGYKYLEIDDSEVFKHNVLKNIEEIFQSKEPMDLSYFYPAGKHNVLLAKDVSIFPHRSYNDIRDFLEDLGFIFANDKQKQFLWDEISDAIEKEIGLDGKLRNVCIGIINIISEGKGRNFGFCGNFFSNELIEQDKEKKANFRLIADLLKYGSEVRSYIISEKETKSIKPEREVDYIMCQKCMAKMPLNARYCGKCGAKLQ